MTALCQWISLKMQKIQPEIKKAQAKYKGDPQRLNKETMALYKKHKVNPLGGCLPVVLQMPLLFALFIVFRTTIEFRGAPFVFWINDLSKPDVVFSLPFSIPISLSISSDTLTSISTKAFPNPYNFVIR